jgi:uncharacterized protein (TIGR02996 family)
MTDAAALLAAVRQAPADDAPRLVYADWLDEHGQPERAEFIRVQCELARHDSPALRRREAELLAAHHDAFAGPLAAPHLRFRFRRGFIARFGHAGMFAGRHGTMMVLFRFFSDGLVICTTGREPEDVLGSFSRENKYLLRGTYELEASEFPATIRFECTSTATTQDIRFIGTFDGEVLSPDGNARYCGYPMLRRFTYQSFTSLHSFPET